MISRDLNAPRCLPAHTRIGIPLAVAAALLALAAAPPLHAQSRTTAMLRGTVLQADSTPVAGATVEMRHEGTGATKSTLTNAEGQFLILLLPPGGPYTLTVSHLGFAEERVEGLTLQVGDQFPVEILVQEEAIALEGIEVEVDPAAVFDVSQVGPATRLTERTIQAMPILSRDILELTVLSPLVRTTDSGGYSIAGQNDRYNAILVDGLVSKDMFGLTSGGVPGGQAGAKLIPIDAVSQYEILVAPFDVRLSGFTGGVMNAVTRTGTNDWRIRAGGVHRNETFMGDLSLPSGPVEASGVDRSLVALSVGGPLIRDALHFFVTGEFERRHRPPSGYNLGRDDPLLTRVSPDGLDTVREIFDTRLGIDIGRADPYPLEQDLANVFGRADWNFDSGDRMTLRHIFAHAANDQEPNRSAFRPYELSTNGVFRSSTNHITALQYFTDLSDRLSNEVNLTLQRTTDHTTPASDLPQIEVGIFGNVGETPVSRSVRFGGQFFGQVNDLSQTSLRLTNSLDLKVGDDVVTMGVTGAWYGITHAFLPGAQGEYFFAGLPDIEREANAPYRYQRTVLAEGADEAIGFDVIEWGVFAQRQINAGKGLTMHFGIRADVPHVIGRPERNFDIESFFGYDTSELPSGNILLSPRAGFNWQSGGERNTQIRGGMGFFTGQVPYVWLSNAFHNDGLRSVTQTCTGRWYSSPPEGIWLVPPYDPSAPALTSCDVQSPSAPPFQEVRTGVVFDPDFTYPQDLKLSVIADRELSERLTGSLGLFFNKALNQVGIQDMNASPGGSASERLLDLAGDERRYYDQIDDDYEHVLLVNNEGEDWAASVTAELRGTLTDRLGFQLGYSLARTWDRTSLVHTDMITNFGSTPTSEDLNRPPLRTSNFDRPHKFVAAVFGAPFPGLPDTEISVLYTGQSGLPFSYVYGGDVNGDGYPGLGGAFDLNNDLLHIPNPMRDAPLGLVTRALFEAAIRDDECLRRNEGRTMRRNDCRAPWENRLDVKLAHTLGMGSGDVRFEADFINLLSLLEPEWGRVQRTSPTVSLLDLCERAFGCGLLALAEWGGAVLPQRDDEGRLRATDPWTILSPESQWQLQLGVRVTFGGVR